MPSDTDIEKRRQKAKKMKGMKVSAGDSAAGMKLGTGELLAKAEAFKEKVRKQRKKRKKKKEDE